MKLIFTYPFPPMASKRPRSGNGRVYHDPEYMAFKAALALAIRAQFSTWAHQVPGMATPAARRKFLAGVRYRLYCEAHLPRRGGDWDNFGKTVSDAIEQSGIIANDEQIDDGRVLKFIDKAHPRVYFRLEVIEPGAHVPESVYEEETA